MPGNMTYVLRPLVDADRATLSELLQLHWGSEYIVVHGVSYSPATLPGYVAECEDECLGLITYRIQDRACEIINLNSFRQRCGIGTALLHAVVDAARREGCRRVWLISTNDNLNALRFYQKRNFHLSALHRNAVTHARAIKPSIPMLAANGIPIRNELELEHLL